MRIGALAGPNRQGYRGHAAYISRAARHYIVGPRKGLLTGHQERLEVLLHTLLRKVVLPDYYPRCEG